MRRNLLLPVVLCLSIMGCTKNPQETPTQHNEKITTPMGLKGQHHILPGIDQYRLLVKFKADDILGLEKNKPVFSNQRATASAEVWRGDKKDMYAFTYEQVIPFDAGEKAAMLNGRVEAAEPGQFDRYAFRGMMYVQEAVQMTAAEVLKLANEFEKMDIVEYAAMEPVTQPPPPAAPDLSGLQYYKNDADGSGVNVRGINAEYAWSIGVTGAGIRVADIEYGYNKYHEDLVGTTCQEALPPPGNNANIAHGTAVAGVLMGKKNSFGITGMVHGVDAYYVVSDAPKGRVGGIAEGIARLRRGDVFMYELQSGGKDGYVAADINQAVWDITKAATDAGIIVVAAAGNGNQNMDDPYYDSYRARGDNGSIIVAAGYKSGRGRAYFSSYGSTVHLQGWGDWTVTTIGYAGLYDGGANALYTGGFSGTSAATPVVASAVVAVQSWYKARTGNVLSPRDMRNLLISTGTPQGPGGHTGPLPNIKAAIVSLGGPDNIDIVSGATYKIVAAVNDSSVLDVAGAGTADGSQVHLWSAVSPVPNNQKWVVTSIGGGYYKLRPANAPSKALDVANGSNADGTQVQIYADNPGNAQKWQIKSVAGSGYYTLSPANAPAASLDISGGRAANGTKVQIWASNPSKAQKFLFIRL